MRFMFLIVLILAPFMAFAQEAAPVEVVDVPMSTMAILVAWVLGVLALLKGLADFLHHIKDSNDWEWDNKLHAFLVKVIGFLAGLVDFVSANSRTKPK